MNKVVLFFLFFFLVRCYSEIVPIYSKIDAIDHEEILNVTMNSKRFALRLFMKKNK